MAVHSLSNSEKELNFFISRINANGISQTVEVHEIDMSGWRLFECFLHPAQTVVYIGWDEDTDTPEWIDMEDDATAEYASLLTDAILQFKKRGKAA